MTPFSERAEDMGLDISGAHKGLYSYEDRYSKIAYRSLASIDLQHFQEDLDQAHPTDGLPCPMIGIWTSPSDASNYAYVGFVSQMYKFIGNAPLIDRVRGSLTEVGTPILNTNIILLDDLTAIREEIVLQSSLSSQQAGDIHPVMIIGNSYNGQRSASVGFGIAVDEGENIGTTTFGFSLGEMKMVHVESSNTRLTSGINLYLEVFNDHIIDMIDRTFQTQLTEEQMFGTLDVIEKYGKRRASKITDILSALQPVPVEGQPPPLPSAWNVFLAITRYCALEPNLNMKRMLENIAESVLVVPTRMLEVLEQLQ
jgi:hypothetical protein